MERETKMAEIKELTDEALEQINGGVLVHTKDGWYHLMEDDLGLYIGSIPIDDAEIAQQHARKHHYSDEIITPAEFQERFHRPFLYGE